MNHNLKQEIGLGAVGLGRRVREARAMFRLATPRALGRDAPDAGRLAVQQRQILIFEFSL